MTLQQAAGQHATEMYSDVGMMSWHTKTPKKAIESAFLAGASFAAQAFAEWCRKNYCTIDSHRYPEHKEDNSWYVPGTKLRYTTAELYDQWQKSLI
jgi:hypothetical protein